MPDIGILVIDSDRASQRALKGILDAEGWRVRIVSTPKEALGELAARSWNLVIASILLVEPQGPLFAILRELAEASEDAGYAAGKDATGDFVSASPISAPPAKPRLRVLFLVPGASAAAVQPNLERHGLPYALKPYHLHDFLQRVSDLLAESGAIGQSAQTMGHAPAARLKARAPRSPFRQQVRGAMFASREGYEMTEEEMAEWERQEEQERKRRVEKRKSLENLG